MPNQAQKRVINLQRNQHLLYIGVFSLVAAIVWVGTSLFQSQRSTGIDPELQQLAEPLNPNINTFAIDRLEQRRSFSAEELADFPIFKIELEEEGRTRQIQNQQTQEQAQSEQQQTQQPQPADTQQQDAPTQQPATPTNPESEPLTNSEGTPIFPIDEPARPNDSI